MQFVFFKYVRVMSLKNIHTLFDDVKFNTQGYFENCAVFLRAQKVYHYPPLFNFLIFLILVCETHPSHKECAKDENKTKETSKLYYMTNKKICPA